MLTIVSSVKYYRSVKKEKKVIPFGYVEMVSGVKTLSFSQKASNVHANSFHPQSIAYSQSPFCTSDDSISDG